MEGPDSNTKAPRITKGVVALIVNTPAACKTLTAGLSGRSMQVWSWMVGMRLRSQLAGVCQLLSPPAPVQLMSHSPAAGPVKMNRDASSAVLDPTGVVTTTSTGPSPDGGVTTTISSSLFTVKLGAAASPKLTWVAPVNPLPVIVTDSPPTVDPSDGSTPVTTGAAGATVVEVVVVDVLVVLVLAVVEVMVVVDVVVGWPGSCTGPTGSARCMLDPAGFSARTDTRINRPRSSSTGEYESEPSPTTRQSLGASPVQLDHENT